jgi:hypothetical protein
MTNFARALAAAAVLFSVACAHGSADAPPPATAEPASNKAEPVSNKAVMVSADVSAKYPYLARALAEIARARKHVQAAEAAHADHGTIGGHGAQADNALADAARNVEEAAAFAASNDHGGAPGEVKDRPLLTATSDDGRHPNLGEARLETERAVRNLEDAEAFHSTIGKLGGHAKSAIDKCHEALREIGEAEKFADVHK